MADKRITQLNQIISIQDDDVVVIVDTSEAQTARATKLQLEQSFSLGNLQGDTDDINEGSINLYWTNTRFDNRLATKTSDDINEGSTNLYLTPANLSTVIAANITTDDIPEGGSNLYYTQARFNNAFGAKTTNDLLEGSNLYYTDARFDSRFNTKSTSDLVEGSNLYWTNARFDNRLATKDTDDISEGATNKYYSDSLVNIQIDARLGAPNGIAGLDGAGLIDQNLLPAIGKSKIEVVNTIAERDALVVEEGDFALVLDFDGEDRERLYGYTGSQWVDLKSRDAVESVNGFTGVLNLSTTDIPEGSNLYWTNARFDTQFFAKSTDNLSEGVANLYFTEGRVQDALNNLSIDDLGDVNIVTPPTVPGYYLSWSGTEWVPAPPQTFGDTKDLKASGTDQFPKFLDEKIIGTTDRISITEIDIGAGDKQLQVNGVDAWPDARIDLHAIRNIYYVQKEPQGPRQFASVNEAVNHINGLGDASSTNRYLIRIEPGLYTEAPFTLPSFVYLRGEKATTRLVTNNNNSDFITMKSSTSMYDIELLGPVNAGHSTITFDLTSSVNVTIDTVAFIDGWRFIDGVNNTANSLTVTMINSYASSGAQSVINPFRFESTSSGSTLFICSNYLHKSANPSMSVSHYVDLINASGEFSSFTVDAGLGAIHHMVHIEDGASFTASSGLISNADVGIHIADVGAVSNVDVNNVVLKSLTYDLKVDPINTTGVINVSADPNKVLMNSDNITINLYDRTAGEEAYVVIGDISQALKYNERLNITKLLRETSVVGLVEGGEISDSGTNNILDVGAGTAFLVDQVDDIVKQIQWSDTTLNIPTGEFRYIVVNTDGVAQALSSPPSNLTNFIFLGRAGALTGPISFVEHSEFRSNHHGNKVEEFFREALGPVYSSGSLVSENPVNDLQIDVSSGRYYYGTNFYTPSAETNAAFFVNYRDGAGGFLRQFNQQLIPVKFDNDSGTLQEPTAGYYVKHSFYVVGGTNVSSGTQYGLVVGQTEYADLTVAEQASLPIPPPLFNQSFALIASIIVQQGNPNIVEVRDERPVLGFQATGISASSTHGNLLGLTADDHPQYLLVSGTRAMSGSLNMGGFQITNVGNIDGVDISAHASRHLPNGSDPLTTGVPSNIGSTNQVGVQNAFARQDHIHAHGNQAGGTLHATATQSVAGFMSAADKTLLDNFALGDLSDVDLTGLADGYFLQYSAGSSSWVVTMAAGITDHGALTGLGDDDHTQYHTDARALTWLGTRSTTDLPEGSNLYYTDERVDDRVAVLIQNNTNISWTYNDPANTLTPVLNQVSARAGTGDAFKLIQANANGYLDSSFFNPNTNSVTNRHVNATSVLNTTSATFVAMPAMQVTPPAGEYIVLFNGDFALNSNNKTLEIQVFKNGVAVTNSLRVWTQSNSTNRTPMTAISNVTANGTDVIQMYWRSVDGSTTATVNNRSFQLIKATT